MKYIRDIVIEKLDKECSRARLALAKIYSIVDKVYCLRTKHASSFLCRADVDEIIETLQEFFGENKGEKKNERC